jgi:hypothetical protein
MNFLEALVAGLQGGLDGYLTGQQFLDAQEDRKGRQQERQERAEDRKAQLAIRQAQLADEGVLPSGSVSVDERIRHPWKWEMQNRYEDIGNGFVRDRTMTKAFEADRKEADARQTVKGNLDALLGIEPGMDFGRAAGIAQASRKNPTLFNQILKQSEQGAGARRLRGQLETMFPIGMDLRGGVKVTPELLDAAAENPDIRRNLFGDQDKIQNPPANVNIFTNPAQALNYAQDVGTMFASSVPQTIPPEQRVSFALNQYKKSPLYRPDQESAVLSAIIARVQGSVRPEKTNTFDQAVKEALSGTATPQTRPGITNQITPPASETGGTVPGASPDILTDEEAREARRSVAPFPAAMKKSVLKEAGYTDDQIAVILRQQPR